MLFLFKSFNTKDMYVHILCKVTDEGRVQIPSFKTVIDNAMVSLSHLGDSETRKFNLNIHLT